MVREYLGKGPLAQLVAEIDALQRDQREAARAGRRARRAELAALDTDFKALAATIDLVARAALRAAGYHQHKRGEWRKHRVKHDESR